MGHMYRSHYSLWAAQWYWGGQGELHVAIQGSCLRAAACSARSGQRMQAGSGRGRGGIAGAQRERSRGGGVSGVCQQPGVLLLPSGGNVVDSELLRREDARVLLLAARAAAEACKQAVAEGVEGARELSEKEAAEAVCQVFTNSLEFEPGLPVASACAGSAAQQGARCAHPLFIIGVTTADIRHCAACYMVFTNSLKFEPALPVASACAGSFAQQGAPMPIRTISMHINMPLLAIAQSCKQCMGYLEPAADTTWALRCMLAGKWHA